MGRKKNHAKLDNVVPAFGNGFLDAAFSSLKREMDLFGSSFDNENVTTIYDKKALGKK